MDPAQKLPQDQGHPGQNGEISFVTKTLGALAFTPAKFQEDIVNPAFGSREYSDWETIEDCESDFENDLPTIDVNCEDWAEQFTKSVQKFHNIGNVVNCENCGEVFTPEHQC